MIKKKRDFFCLGFLFSDDISFQRNLIKEKKSSEKFPPQIFQEKKLYILKKKKKRD